MTNNVARWTELLDWIDSFGEVEIDEDFRATTCIALAVEKWREIDGTPEARHILDSISRGEGPGHPSKGCPNGVPYCEDYPSCGHREQEPTEGK